MYQRLQVNLTNGHILIYIFRSDEPSEVKRGKFLFALSRQVCNGLLSPVQAGQLLAILCEDEELNDES